MLKEKMYVCTPTKEIFIAVENFLFSSGFAWESGTSSSNYWITYKEDTVIFCPSEGYLTFGDLQYARNVKIKPLDFTLILEDVIKVGEYKVNFCSNGDIGVGCQNVTKGMVEKIYKKSQEMKNGHS